MQCEVKKTDSYLFGIIIVAVIMKASQYFYAAGFRGVNIPPWVFVVGIILGAVAYLFEKMSGIS